MKKLFSSKGVKGIDVTKFNVFLRICYDFTGLDKCFSQKSKLIFDFVIFYFLFVDVGCILYDRRSPRLPLNEYANLFNYFIL